MAVILSATACSDRLDLFPRTSVTPETVSSDDLETLLNGVYAALRDGGTSYWALGSLVEDLSADNLLYRATFFQHGEIDNNAMLANNVLIQRYWLAPYTIIQRANDVLEVLATAEIDAAEKNRIEAEARFLRGYGYYRLVTLFGGVPIITSRDPDENIVPRNTEDEVYNYIIEDIKFATTNARPRSESGVYYVSQEAAKLVLARVYLIRGNNADAKTLADELVASSSFDLVDEGSYNSIWSVTAPNELENIFVVSVTTNDNGVTYHGFFLRHPSMPGGGRAELPITPDLYNAYEANDVRRTVITHVPGAYGNANYEYYCYKFQDPGNYTCKFYIARTAEAYLISAEASYKLNPSDPSVLTNINALRAKRGASALASVDLYDIINERRLELAVEGTRWTDMKRTPSETVTGKSMALVFLEAKGRGANDLLYPIPTSAMDVNEELVQNPGY